MTRLAFAKPAFYAPGSVEDGLYNGSEDGLTVREYFAARAPHEIPDWFQPVLRSAPEMPRDRPDLSGIPRFQNNEFMGDHDMDAASRRNYVLNIAHGWLRDPCFDLEVEHGQYPSRTSDEQRALWDAARPRVRAFVSAWEAYWVDKNLWLDEKSRARVAQWPWAWADLVLAAGGAQ